MHGESDSKFGTGFGPKRKAVEDPEFDVTAMVDLVSLMNIYFLVAWVMAMQNEVDLPAAKWSERLAEIDDRLRPPDRAARHSKCDPDHGTDE